MTRQQLDEYISGEYGIEKDFPFEEQNIYVFRHKDNRKWFALVMEISAEKLGGEQTNIWVVNIKCDPILKAGFLSQQGIYPAYHMSKEHWLTIRLDEANEKDIETLISISFDLTAKKYKKRSA